MTIPKKNMRIGLISLVASVGVNINPNWYEIVEMMGRWGGGMELRRV